MKIILSRKGFDSSNGGIVSPIFEDGTMVSFPIPSDDKDTFNDLYYNGKSYKDILNDLGYKGTEHCHVDPDLTLERREKDIKGWQPVFGQCSSSAAYLCNNVKIQVGDIFLFFGNFHHVKLEDGKYKYVKKTKDFYMDNDLQVIWGYMQVGEIITDPNEQLKSNWHPHSSNKMINKTNNVMFIASEKLSLNPNMPGAGMFKYSLERVLTMENASKATWIKNAVYDVDSIFGGRKNSSKKSNGLYYAGIWQELGLKPSAACEKWAKKIIKA